MRERLSTLLILGLTLPFLGKPVHIDDANFVAMAEHAASDPWRPHNFTINWQGTSESAFYVLSNPPGIAWWLSPFAHASTVVMHLWMMPWLFLAMWGAARLGRAIGTNPSSSILLLCGAPISIIAAQALTPDLPLLALTLAGFGGLLTGAPNKRWVFALTLGTASLFRYSGLVLIPLIFLLPLSRLERCRSMVWASIPICGLMLHDWVAYDQVHLFAMMAFQSVSNSGTELAHKAVALVAALGGVAALPILCWNRKKYSFLGGITGAIVGFAAATLTEQSNWTTTGTVLFTAAGAASLAGVAQAKDTIDRFLIAWMLLGTAFLLSLRFAASRYWIPFFAPVVLLGLRTAPKHLVRWACVATVTLSAAIAVDDMDLALTQQRAALQTASIESGQVAGHWGFQYYLEKQGWIPVEDDQQVPSSTWVATSNIAWPQQASNQCWTSKTSTELRDPRPGIRVMTYDGGANLHGNMLASETPIRTFSPWWFADDPLDTLTLRRTCP